MITVIVDWGWCRRYYGHGFDAESGVPVIIGVLTKRVLYTGVSNNYCVACKIAELQKQLPKNHKSKKNWDFSSASVES